MSKIKLELNYDAFNAVRNSPAVQAKLLSMAGAIASRATAAGCECEADVKPGLRRAHARVSTLSDHAVRNNLHKNTLLKSLDAGRQ